ncbi:RING-type domain-containing protein [Caenorhabditis elegans]|uniref:RING-type domain-containing protein n=2 Tax=Caenorhabditis elegans TaxID=6239 RepID=O16680_CAEEL|nr:RING-type domain-containing protein [Caenorhabditis elegans]CCD61645.2 RING-type domain-containing protein [Caenorhabditis elegans]
MTLPECEICCKEYSNIDQNHSPKILKCGHSICQICAAKLITNSCIYCPFCRETTKIRDGKVENLKKNFGLMKAIEIMKNSTTKQDTPGFSPTKCSAHPYNLAEFVCMGNTCSAKDKFMCRTCEEFGIHKGHARGLLISESAKLREILECRFEKMELNNRIFEEQLKEIRKAGITNITLFNQKVGKVNLHFKKLHRLLSDQEEAIIEKLELSSSKTYELNLEKENKLLQSQEELAKKMERMKTRINLNDTQLFIAGVEMRGPTWYYENELPDCPPATDDVEVRLPTIKIKDCLLELTNEDSSGVT